MRSELNSEVEDQNNEEDRAGFDWYFRSHSVHV